MLSVKSSPASLQNGSTNKGHTLWVSIYEIYDALCNKGALIPFANKECADQSDKKQIFLYFCLYQIKNRYFYISAENIDCVYSLEPPRRGGSNDYPQSMFLSTNKKNNTYPC